MFAFYYSLPQYLKDNLIRSEKRATAIIMSNVDNRGVRKLLNIKPMENHRENLCEISFRSVMLVTNKKFVIYYRKDIIQATF